MQNDEPVFDYHLAFEAVKFYLGRFSEDSLEGPDFIANAAYQAAIYIDDLEKEIKLKDNHKDMIDGLVNINYELLLHELEAERHEKRILEKRISKLSRDIGNSLN